MYLHIGQDTVIRTDDILGIFDLDTSSVSPLTKEFLGTAQKSGGVVSVTDDLPKSFIVCAEEKDKAKVSVYISQISSSTLLKRAEGENRDSLI